MFQTKSTKEIKAHIIYSIFISRTWCLLWVNVKEMP